jgi:hypothetical protein
MAKKPAGDLGSMAISKAKAAAARPFATGQPAAAVSGGSVKSLTVKLDGVTYAALRAYCYEQERVAGSRLTHQQVMVEALKTFLAGRE